ncbi:MAG: hypothetical protein LBQ59_02045 [Candidatus Peribacteria bacterium]|nr:hypothetical protein [Candidatus Peribacteria bacterium]
MAEIKNKKVSFIEKCVRKIKPAIKSLYLWCEFNCKRLRDFIKMLFFDLITIGYSFVPSAIRFRLYASVKFLKIQKHVFLFLFYIKRAFFNFTGCVKNVKDDCISYFKNIFLKYWKLTLFMLFICVGIFLIEQDYSIKIEIENFANKLIHSPCQDKLFDLYTTLAGIIGTFLGLYFTAISIIAQTIYTKVNGEIGKLLNSIRLSNIYVKSLIFLLAFLLVSIFMMIQGIQLGIINFYIVFAFSFVSLICFWELALYIFLFFNPVN